MWEEKAAMKKQVLSIRLSDELNKVFRYFYQADGVDLIACQTANEVVNIMGRERFCLILFNSDGLSSDQAQEAVSRLRTLSAVPLLVICEISHAAAIMEVGADVCVPIQADIHALFAQTKALIRRHTEYDRIDDFSPAANVLFRSDLVIDATRHCVTQAGVEVPLFPREFRLLNYMAHNQGIVLTPEQIRVAVWLSESNSERDVSPLISELRKKLGDTKEQHRYIETVHGVGYRFVSDTNTV